MGAPQKNILFGPALQAVRDEVQLSRAVVAKRLGKSVSYLAMLETGHQRAPDRSAVRKLAKALTEGHAPSARAVVERRLWEVAAPDRLEDSDPDLWEWHRDQVASATGDLTQAELQLFTAIRSRPDPRLACRSLRTYLSVVADGEVPTNEELALIGELRRIQNVVEQLDAHPDRDDDNAPRSMTEALRNILEEHDGPASDVEAIAMLRDLAGAGEDVTRWATINKERSHRQEVVFAHFIRQWVRAQNGTGPIGGQLLATLWAARDHRNHELCEAAERLHVAADNERDARVADAVERWEMFTLTHEHERWGEEVNGLTRRARLACSVNKLTRRAQRNRTPDLDRTDDLLDRIREQWSSLTDEPWPIPKF